MALVAYSDGSDISDSDEENQKISSKELNGTEICGENKIIQNGNLQQSPVKNEEADDVSEAADENDVMNDVPTVQTWNIIKNKEPCATIGQIFKKDPKSKKLKLVLPALSEFDEEDDDEDMKDEDIKRKKIQPSSRGTGLFAVLPKPKSGSTTSLVPLHVSKKMANKLNNVKKEKPKKLPENKHNDSDEEWDTNPSSDFFSLEKSDSPPPLEFKMEPVANVKPKLDISQELSQPSASEQPNYEVEQAVIHQPGPFVIDAHSAETPVTHHAERPEIDTEALRRLTGRRNLEEVPNIIDINADDALMSKDEWIKRTLCDEKPKTSFSRKREGIPTYQQRRKHQITYLAHQAQEREQDLQNTWGQNRFTKLQTQSRYGF